MARRCKVGTEVQTLIFDKGQFSKHEAIDWAHRNNFYANKVDETATSFRLRQWAPSRYKKKSFRTISLGESGIRAVMACPKK